MAKITSVEDLKDYCLRRLGAPVINIEIDNVQAYERIDDAIEYFVERHFDGVEEQHYKHTITRTDVENGYISVPSNFVSITDTMKTQGFTSGDAMFDIEYQMMQDVVWGGHANITDYYLQKQHLSLMNSFFSPSRSFTYNCAANRLRPAWQISDVGSGNMFVEVKDVTATEWVKTNATATSLDATDPKGLSNAHTVASDAAGTFSIEQTYTSSGPIAGTLTSWFNIDQGTYAGDLIATMTNSNGDVLATKTINPGVQWISHFISAHVSTEDIETITIKIEGTAAAAGETFFLYNPWLYVNNSIILHGYTSIDPSLETDVYNDRWIKEYATAILKRQWGMNIKKFDGVQLPGGVTMNGTQIFEEANIEIEKLEERFSLEYELPVDSFWG